MSNDKEPCVEPALKGNQAEGLPKRGGEMVEEYAEDMCSSPCAKDERRVKQAHIPRLFCPGRLFHLDPHELM